nr:MAG TPA: hypothetical protein [Caudoviricetes sp.]
MFKRAPMSTAELIKRNLEQQALKEESINLYPDIDKDLTDDLDFYKKYTKAQDKTKLDKDLVDQFSESVNSRLLECCLYQGMLKPVLKEQFCNSHERKLGKTLVRNFIKEHDAFNLIQSLKDKSCYLNEWYEAIKGYHTAMMNEAKEIAQEGIPEAELFDIEDDTIKKFVFDTKSIIPKDITKMITSRVEDAVNDFIDQNKKQKEEIKKVYEKAKEKVASLKDTIDPNDPSFQDFNGDPNTELDPKYGDQVQEQAMAMVRGKQRAFREEATSVFSILSKNTLEAIHRNQAIKESYSVGITGRLDFQKAINDTKVMYSFLECLNTLNIMDLNESTLSKLLTDMKNSIREENSVTNVAPSNPTAPGSEKASGTMTVNTNNAAPAQKAPTATTTNSGTEGNTLS